MPVRAALDLDSLSFADWTGRHSGRKVGVVPPGSVVARAERVVPPVSGWQHWRKRLRTGNHNSWPSWSGSRPEELSPLAEVNRGVSICVNSSHDGEELGLRCPVSLVSEESTEIDGGDESGVVPVDRSEGGS